MKLFKNLAVLAVTAVLAACVIGVYVTRDVTTSRVPAKKPAANNQTPLVDDRLLQTAPAPRMR